VTSRGRLPGENVRRTEGTSKEAPFAGPRGSPRRSVGLLAVVVAAGIVMSLLIGFLVASLGSRSGLAGVSIDHLSAVASCPPVGEPTVTFSFVLSNRRSEPISASITFYEQGSPVGSGRFDAGANSSAPEMARMAINGCPPIWFSFGAELTSVDLA
jgi:hypothetical protein